MRTDGSGERILSNGWEDEGPTWAPNGRVLMFTRTLQGGRGSANLVCGHHGPQRAARAYAGRCVGSGVVTLDPVGGRVHNKPRSVFFGTISPQMRYNVSFQLSWISAKTALSTECDCHDQIFDWIELVAISTALILAGCETKPKPMADNTPPPPVASAPGRIGSDVEYRSRQCGRSARQCR